MRETYSPSNLLHRAITVPFPTGVSAHEERLGSAVLKPDETVLPVTDVVAKPDVEHRVAQVEAVKEEPECIDGAIALVGHYQNNGCVAVAGGTVGRTDRLATVSTAHFFHELLLALVNGWY